MNEATCTRLLDSLHLGGGESTELRKQIKGSSPEELKKIHDNLRRKAGSNLQHKVVVGINGK